LREVSRDDIENRHQHQKQSSPGGNAANPNDSILDIAGKAEEKIHGGLATDYLP
jgi:hypothetical protein